MFEQLTGKMHRVHVLRWAVSLGSSGFPLSCKAISESASVEKLQSLQGVAPPPRAPRHPRIGLNGETHVGPGKATGSHLGNI